MNNKDYKSGFARGMAQVQNGDNDAVKKRLFEVMKTTDRSKLSRYLNGITEPRATLAQAIEKVFSEFGICDIWGPVNK